MKFCWRITKYNPEKRNLQGRFLEETWTSFSDIGKIYQDKEFAYEEYIYFENCYLNAIINFMKCLDISYLQVKELENSKRIYTDSRVTKEEIAFVKAIKENDLLTIEQVIMASKLILREYFWCKLISKHKMFVHFGYDYYMYIGSRLECKEVIQNIKDSGLYIENFKSPYE